MKQMTVLDLAYQLVQLVKQGQGNKAVVVSDDNEGNGYHGCFYGVTADPNEVRGCIDGLLYDSKEMDYDNIVIIG